VHRAIVREDAGLKGRLYTNLKHRNSPKLVLLVH